MVQRVARLPIILIPFVVYSSLGWSASWQQDGSVGATTEYATNPTLLPAYRTGVWQCIFAPAYSLRRIGESNELNAGIALQLARSSNKALIQDRNDPSASIGWNWQTDAAKFGISAKYNETSTLVSDFGSTGPRLVDSSRASRIISGNWNQKFSERSTLIAEGTYERVSYSSQVYTNYLTRSANMMFKYDWNEFNTPYAKVSYVDYEPENVNLDVPSHSESASLGLNWEASEYLKGILQVGKSRDSSAGMGIRGLVSVRYTGQRTGLVLNASRQDTPTGLGGFATVDQANGSWSFALNELNKFGIDLGRQKYHYADEVISNTAGVWLQRDINLFWVTRAYYQHRNSSQAGISEANSDSLGVVFTYTRANF